MDACAEYAAQAFSLQELVEKKFDDGTLHTLLEQRYDSFIAALKRRIPMAEFVMTGAIEAGVKEQVQTEINKLLPELKAKVLERLMTPEEVQELVKASLLKLDWKQIRIPLKARLGIIFSLGAVSFILGLLQLLFFLIYCT
ncbi:MAG: hypothetical protein LLG04_12350 [Parachlamydia sp.]|nr:hypothetical protein [Parachlamydia sp.]